MKLLFLAALTNFILFTAVGVIKKLRKDDKLPKSLSMMFYVVSKLYFVWFLLSSTGAISVFNQTLMPDQFSVTNTFAWMLCGVGFFSGIDNPTIMKIHITLAVSGFAGVLIGMWIDYGVWQPTVISTVSGLLLYLSLRSKPWKILPIEVMFVSAMLYGYYTLIF